MLQKSSTAEKRRGPKKKRTEKEENRKGIEPKKKRTKKRGPKKERTKIFQKDRFANVCCLFLVVVSAPAYFMIFTYIMFTKKI